VQGKAQRVNRYPEKKIPLRSFHTSETRLFCPDSSAVNEKPSISTVHEMWELPVTRRPVNPFAGSLTWVTSPPPDQLIVMLSTPTPIGAPWDSALPKVPKSSISKSSTVHVARPRPGATATDRSGTRAVQNNPLAAMPGLKSWI
jgi:hypothetical protein